ncbi:MAG: response regulator [Mesorhizobium sp.]|nr:response regulator [Mesorhizobium sp.]
MSEILEDMGHTICATASTEAGAVAAALETRPDLMIVDARLGEGSGIAAVARIIGKGFVPHIFVTGDSMRDRPLHPRSIVVQKPFLNADIARAVDRALGAGVA